MQPLYSVPCWKLEFWTHETGGGGRVSGWVRSGHTMCRESRVGSGWVRVGSTFHRGRVQKNVTRGQLYAGEQLEIGDPTII